MDHVVIAYGTQPPDRNKVLFIGSPADAKAWDDKNSTPCVAVTYRMGYAPINWPPARPEDK